MYSVNYERKPIKYESYSNSEMYKKLKIQNKILLIFKINRSDLLKIILLLGIKLFKVKEAFWLQL